MSNARIRDEGAMTNSYDDDNETNENDPLISMKKKHALRSHLMDHLDRSRFDLALLLSYVVTGLLDSSATVIWGPFVSMQTGNTIYVGLGTTDPSLSNRWIKSIVSIVSFCVGSFAFARLHRAWGSENQRTRILLIGSSLMQFILIATAAMIVHFTSETEPGDKHDLHWHVLAPLALVAIQSAGQTSLSRALECGYLTSTVLTTIYCDLFSDQGLFAGLRGNVQRNQRAVAPLLLLLGAVVGGLWARSEFGIEGALWTALGLKGLLTLSLLVWWKSQDGEETQNIEYY